MENAQQIESQKHGNAEIRTYSVARLGESLDRIATADAKTAESAIMTLRPKIAQMLESGACTISDVIIALQQGGMDLGRRQICKYLAAAGINRTLKPGAHGGAPARRKAARTAAPSGRGDGRGDAPDMHADVHSGMHSDVHAPAPAEDMRSVPESVPSPAEGVDSMPAADVQDGASGADGVQPVGAAPATGVPDKMDAYNRLRRIKGEA